MPTTANNRTRSRTAAALTTAVTTAALTITAWAPPASASASGSAAANTVRAGAESADGVLPVVAASAKRPVIDHPDFARVGGLTLAGSARGADGTLRLTDGGKRQAGAVWSSTKIDTGKSFETAFTARLDEGADGIAFVIQNDGPAALGGSGGSLGYGGLTHSVAVEFDTYQNEHDPNDNHIAVVENGHSGTVHDATVPARISLTGDPFLVRVSYDAGSGSLRIRIKATDDPEPVVKILNVPADLARATGSPSAYVGFTGGTGYGVSTQDIHSWTLKQ
jgi:hypothetical protein